MLFDHVFEMAVMLSILMLPMVRNNNGGGDGTVRLAVEVSCCRAYSFFAREFGVDAFICFAEEGLCGTSLTFNPRVEQCVEINWYSKPSGHAAHDIERSWP